jgi:FtsP/CotA-like multicopper oxidase with cupredoxin domain/cytochrome c biogenesis protein CcdA
MADKEVSTKKQPEVLKVAPATKPASTTSETKMRSGLIFAAIGVFAAIIFGLFYLFVFAPNIPNASLGWFLFSFATGLTMIVMPCTLPLAFVIVPLSMGKGMIKGISMAVAFGVGVAITLSLYGVAAALLGGLAIDALGADLESVKNWVYFIAGGFALIFALSEIGLLNIHMPSYSGAAPAFIQKRQELLKALFLGMFLGNVGVGCPHPATPLILIEIASSGDVIYGWFLFLIHAIGRVLPLLLLAFLAILGVNGLNWLMARKETVERTTGWAMVFVAGFILTLGLFSHDWWVNSGIHSALEVVTQESRLTGIVNETLGTDVAHAHGLEEGEGLFGLPLHWGSWFLVLLWIVPIWWWWFRKRKRMYSHPSFKIKELEKEIDRIETDRRQIESMTNMEELDQSFDLGASQATLDELEKARRESTERAKSGEEGVFADATAREYEVKVLNLHRNYLIAVTIMLALVFVYFMPTNFYLKSMIGGDHHAVGTASDGHTDHSHAAVDFDMTGAHQMPDGSIMNASGEILTGAHMMEDGTIMFADGTMMGGEGMMGGGMNVFTTDARNLPEATGPVFVDLADGDSYDITAAYVQNEVGNRTLRMLAYNGSIPGPFIRVDEGSEVTINFTNDTDIDQTIHSHGVRLDNNSDGVPYVTQDPVPPGGTYTYTIRFDDPGAFWYHPHTREDYGQELGLYGNYFVDPSDSEYWSAVNREVPLVIDDILIENDKISAFYENHTNFALIGRFGNEYLVNGVQDFTTTVREGEVIRFFITNVSNARTYNLSIPGARIKRVGADLGKFERETYEESLLISPAERLVVEVYFENEGAYKLMNTTPDGETELARFLATDSAPAVSYEDEFNVLRTNSEVVSEFEDFRSYLPQVPDKELLLTIDLAGMAVDHSMHTGHGDAAPVASAVSTDRMDKIQWDDPIQSDRVNKTPMIAWQMKDVRTGKVNMDIDDWNFKVGDLVKIRLTNDANADHVMQHPIHFHGQQFVVLEENGVENKNLAWKDTVLVFPGETVDILVDMNNPGEWMNHCHIAEHLHAGMMLGFRVENMDGTAPGDEYRSTVSDSEMQQMHSSGDIGNMDQMMDMTPQETQTTTQPEGPSPYNYTDDLADSTYSVRADKQIFKAGRVDSSMLSFFDSAGNPVSLSGVPERALNVVFVKSDNTTWFETYPGNTAFPEAPAAPAPSNENVPGTPGFDESMPHSHSFLGINRALAHGEIIDDGHHLGNTGRTYTVPVNFPSAGNYKGYVEFILEGEENMPPRVATFSVDVTSYAFSIDDFGWSVWQERLILTILSILLIIPLVFGVRRYINEKKV